MVMWMMKVLVAILLTVCSSSLYSQTQIYTVRGGDNPSRLLPNSFRYLNPEFRKGYLSFVAGEQSESLNINYDLLNRALVFIRDQKDTLLIKDDLAVTRAVIGGDTFYHDLSRGYLRMVASDSSYKIASNTELLKTVKAGTQAYGGTPIGTTATSTMSRQKDVSYERITRYYLVDQNGGTVLANRSGFLHLFPGKESLIRSYLKKEKTDFEKEEDIVKLLHFVFAGNNSKK